MKFTFTPEPEIAEQLQELARITQRSIGNIINDVLRSPLNQMVDDLDTDYMQILLEGVEYPDHATAAVVAKNYNSLNWEIVMKSKGMQWNICNAWAGDDNAVHFTKSRLVKASDFEPGRKATA